MEWKIGIQLMKYDFMQRTIQTNPWLKERRRYVLSLYCYVVIHSWMVNGTECNTYTSLLIQWLKSIILADILRVEQNVHSYYVKPSNKGFFVPLIFPLTSSLGPYSVSLSVHIFVLQCNNVAYFVRLFVCPNKIIYYGKMKRKRNRLKDLFALNSIVQHLFGPEQHGKLLRLLRIFWWLTVVVDGRRKGFPSDLLHAERHNYSLGITAYWVIHCYPLTH